MQSLFLLLLLEIVQKEILITYNKKVFQPKNIIVEHWNNLPDDIVGLSAGTTSSFKNRYSDGQIWTLKAQSLITPLICNWSRH